MCRTVMTYRIVKPYNLTADVVLPASKSISNRALALSLLSGTPTACLSNLSACDDTAVMLRAMSLPEKVDIGAAGTSMRFLTVIMSLSPGRRLLTGSARMCQRPIGVLVDALRQLGADIAYVGREGFPPLVIRGRALHGGMLDISGSVSSQYVSALLMIGPCLGGGLRLHLTGDVVSRPYIDMTLAMMSRFGADARWADEATIVVAPKAYVAGGPYHVESDWSAASYWYEMMLLSDNPGETCTLHGLTEHSLQGDSTVAALFAQLSVQTLFASQGSDVPKVHLMRRGDVASPFVADMVRTPDLAQTFAVACALKDIPFRLSGLHSLRIKETDRIAALSTELAKLGVQVEVEGDDVMHWPGAAAQRRGSVPYLRPLPDTAIATYDDHRMAMAFAPAALVLGSIDIEHPEVVSKSYPTFWDDLVYAGFEITTIV